MAAVNEVDDLSVALLERVVLPDGDLDGRGDGQRHESGKSGEELHGGRWKGRPVRRSELVDGELLAW